MKLIAFPNFSSFPPYATADKTLIYYDTQKDQRYYLNSAGYVGIPVSNPTPQPPRIG